MPERESVSAQRFFCGAHLPLIAGSRGVACARSRDFRSRRFVLPRCRDCDQQRVQCLCGPTLTGTTSISTPLFATGLAVLLLGERICRQSPPAAHHRLRARAHVMAARRPHAGRLDPSAALLVPRFAASRRLWQARPARLANPFAATLMGDTVSGAAIWVLTGALPPARHVHSTRDTLVVAAGLLNGCAVLFLYQALQNGSVGVVARSPRSTAFHDRFQRAFLRSEALTLAPIIGALTRRIRRGDVCFRLTPANGWARRYFRCCSDADVQRAALLAPFCSAARSMPAWPTALAGVVGAIAFPER